MAVKPFIYVGKIGGRKNLLYMSGSNERSRLEQFTANPYPDLRSQIGRKNLLYMSGALRGHFFDHN